MVAIHKEIVTAPTIDQYYYETRDKVDGLCRILDTTDDCKMIIFCRTKKGVDELVIALATRGYEAEGLHGDLSQTQRDRVMKKFRQDQVDILVATDVAARGIDIDNITHVVNFDVPQDPESYVHRIGRTGRAGNTGVALTFITPREFRQLKLIERSVKTKIIRGQLPTDANVLEKQREQIISKMQSILEQNQYHDYLPIAEALENDYDIHDIARPLSNSCRKEIKLWKSPRLRMRCLKLLPTRGLAPAWLDYLSTSAAVPKSRYGISSKALPSKPRFQQNRLAASASMTNSVLLKFLPTQQKKSWP